MSCGTNSSSPDYKVLHRPVPIAWPISFMEGPIVRMQLVSFCHGNENTTMVGRETLAGRQQETSVGALGSQPCESWGARVSVGATVGALWQGEPLPLGPAGGSSGHLEQRRLEPGMHRQGHSATQ